MDVTRLDAKGFLDRAGGFLVEREAEHNLLLGLAARLKRDPLIFGSEAYLAIVEADGKVVAAALRTPPHRLVLSEIDDAAALERLAADVHDAFGSLPGVLGPVAGVRRFVELWEALAGASGRLEISERIYRADSAILPVAVPGRARGYEPGDRELVLRWLSEFIAEALPDGFHEEPVEILDRRLTLPDDGIVLWEDGEPVSVAGYGAPTPNGVRLGPVYTPPDKRGRGYASALVADVTASLLAGGRTFCCLFTDLANPTSNSIYQQVGYRPVTDVDQWRLG